MAKSQVLARVRDDLAQGHTHTAIQRLRTLLAVDPDDLEIYRSLAAVYRQTGNLVEAGRWAYLTENLCPEEQAAFERAHPHPWLRLRLVRWNGDPAALPDAAARERLRLLRENAHRSGPPARWSGNHPAGDPPARSAVPCLFVALTLIVAGTLAAIGVLRAIRLLLG